MNNPMKYEQMMKQINDFQESMLETSMNVMTVYQNRVQKWMTHFWDQGIWASEKMETAMSYWNRFFEIGEAGWSPVPAKVKKDVSQRVEK